ncbi:MAG: hypothetical protein AB1430_07360 [Pseudomonadota bacterium]
MNAAARAVTIALLMLSSGAAGWWLKPQPEPAAQAPLLHAIARAVPAPACAVPSAPEPLVAVARDGNVTLHVEQRPLDWVLEEIEAQTGHPLGPPPRVAPLPTGTACPDAVANDLPQLERTLESGAEPARYEALLQARGAGLELPEQRLQSLFEHDTSPRVRQQAFESYLMLRAHDAQAVRRALERALYVPDAGLQRQAAQQLLQLDELARIDAQSAQRSHPGS